MVAKQTTRSVVIEVGEEAAGVLIEGRHGGYVFHAVHVDLSHLHGTEFRSVQSAEAAARDGLKKLAVAS